MKTVSTIIWVLFLALLGACRGGGEKMPGGVLPPDRMARVTADMLVAKEAYHQKKKVFDRQGINPQKSVLQAYGIDSAAYVRSLDYYSARPALFIRVYRQVDSLIKRRTDSLDRSMENKKVKKPVIKPRKGGRPASAKPKGWRPPGF